MSVLKTPEGWDLDAKVREYNRLQAEDKLREAEYNLGQAFKSMVAFLGDVSLKLRQQRMKT